MTPTPDNRTGPVIAGDPNSGRAPGSEDLFDLFADPNLEVFLGTSWGGEPFRQFYMELFDSNDPDYLGACPTAGGSGGWCTADVFPSNGDGVWRYQTDGDCKIDLADLATLLANYGTYSSATHEQGDVDPYFGGRFWLDSRDGDHDVDLSDLAALLSQYGDDCN